MQSGFSLTAAFTSSNLDENTPLSFTLYDLISLYDLLYDLIWDVHLRLSYTSLFCEKMKCVQYDHGVSLTMRLVKSGDAHQQVSSIYSSVVAMSRFGIRSYTHEMSVGTRQHTHSVLAGIRKLFPTCSIRHITLARGLDGIHVDILIIEW